MGHFSEKYIRKGLIFFRELIKVGALEDLQEDLLKKLAEDEFVGFHCSDGKYSIDLIDHIRRYSGQPHFISLNGAAVLLVPDRLEFADDRATLYRHADEAWHEFEKGKGFVNLTHFPCGKCFKHAIEPPQNIIRTYDGASDISTMLRIPRVRVMPLIQIHWNYFEHENGDPLVCRTYKIKQSCKTEAPRIWQQIQQVA